MKILNIHQRRFAAAAGEVSEILATLSSPNDRIWPKELWPPMILDNGLQIHSRGGHGMIGYYVSRYEPGECVEFTFTRPDTFTGVHRFELAAIAHETTQLTHTIDMTANLKGWATWMFAIKWLHDALLEDCLDKVQHQISGEKVRTEHNFWVRYLRKKFKRDR